MERLTKALNVLYNSKKHYESALSDSRKSASFEREKNAFLEVKEVLVQKEIRKDVRFNEHFARAVELLFIFVSHRDPDVRLVAEQTLTSFFRHMVMESFSSRVVVALLMELKRNGGARSLVVAFHLLAEVIDLVKPNKTGVIGAHIVGALCSIVRRPEDSIQNCLEKVLPRIFTVFSRLYTTYRSEDSYNLYEIALENLVLSGSSSRAASMVIYQLSFYFPELLKKSFKQFHASLLSPEEEKKNVLVGTLNTLRFLWPSIISRKEDFEISYIHDIIRGVLHCFFSPHNDVVVASLEFLDTISNNFLVFVNSLSFKPTCEAHRNSPATEVESISEMLILPGTSSQLGSLNSSLGDLLSDTHSTNTFDGSASVYDGSFILNDNPEVLSGKSASLYVDEDEVLDPLRHGSLNVEELESPISSASSTSGKLTGQFEVLNVPSQLLADINSDNFAEYTAVLLARHFLLSNHSSKQISDDDVRVSHKILAMTCLAQLANCLPNFFNTPLCLSDKLNSLLLKDIQLFINHDDDLLKAAAVTAIVNASRAAFYSSEKELSEATPFLKKCVADVIRLHKPRCSRALLVAAKGASDVLNKLGLTNALCKFACESSNNNYFLLRIAVIEYLTSIEWNSVGDYWAWSLPDFVFETYLNLLADEDSRVAKTAAANFPLLVSNANYCKLRTLDSYDQPYEVLSSAFKEEPLTIALGQQYSFAGIRIQPGHSENLSVILMKMFSNLQQSADELKQAGLVMGLASLAVAFPPSEYPASWSINAHNDASCTGLLVSLLSQSSITSLSLNTICSLFEIISYSFAGVCETNIMKLLKEKDDSFIDNYAKICDGHLLEQLVLSSLRVLNMYYTIIIEREQSSNATKPAVLSPSMSPVRKVLNTGSINVLTEQRTQAVSNLVGTSIKLVKATSFLHSSTLIHLVDSIRGMYSNYMDGLGEDVRDKFIALLSSAMNCLSCVLEMTRLPFISSLFKEILFYCCITVDLASADTVRLVIQLLKVLFARNAINLNHCVLLESCPSTSPSSKDLLESMLLRSANSYTEFVVNSSRKEFYLQHLLKCSGWLRKEVICKKGLTHGSSVSEFIGLFESFVSKVIRLFYVSNSYSFQILTLNLLCELISGGINFSMLDPKMQLLSFLFTFVNEFGSRYWFISETVDSDEVALIRSVFQFFLLISRIETEGHPILEARRMIAFCEVMVNAAIARPQLARCGEFCFHYIGKWLPDVSTLKMTSSLNSLQVVLLEFIVVRKRFEPSVGKVILVAEPLAKKCPTEYMEIWAYYLYGAFLYDEEQSWAKMSLLFFDTFQKLRDTWDTRSAFSGVIALRFCSTATFRPIDAFLKCLTQILLLEEKSYFERLLYSSPYIFMLLCVIDEDYILPSMEKGREMTSFRFAGLLMEMLFGCIKELRNLDLPNVLLNRYEYTCRLIWFLQMMSYALRSAKVKSITAAFSQHIPNDLTDVYDLSVLHPAVFISFLAFYSTLGLADSKLYDYSYNKEISLLCKLILLRGGQVRTLKRAMDIFSHCLPEDSAVILSHHQSALFLKQLSSVFNFLDILVVSEKHHINTLKTLTNLVGKSYALDRCIYSSFRSISSKVCAAPEEVQSMNEFLRSGFRDLFEDPKKCVVESEHDHGLFSLNSVEPMQFDRESLCELIISLIKKAGKVIPALCVSGSFSRFDAICAEKVLRSAYASGRFDIVEACMDELILMNVNAFNCGEMYSEYSVVIVQKAEKLCRICAELAFDPSVDSHLQLYAQSKFAQKSHEIFFPHASKWSADPMRFNYWMQKYTELLSVEELDCTYMEPVIFNAIAFGISQPSLVTAIENADLRKMIELQLQLGESFARILKSLAKGSMLKLTRSPKDGGRLNWDVVVRDRSEKKDIDHSFFMESIQTAFELVMFIQEVFRKKLIESFLAKSLEKLAKAISRLPLFNDVACIPRIALLCKWRVELEIRNDAIAVSTVNVHHLCNVDVLRDFTWRLCWAGWNRYANFNNFSMSLFGVLSSTPTGSELQTANINVTEQIMASSAAIDGLTNILLQTVMFPERGNPVTGSFLMKYRELSGNFISTPSVEINSVFQKNLEFVGKNSERYYPGQLSVHAIWNMTGVLDLERNLFRGSFASNSPSLKNALPSVESSYLLESGHDSTNESCLRMLFDIYSHWFRTGIDAVPISLLSAIIKSMLLLSDLFVDLDQFQFVFNHMKSLFAVRSHIENIDLGNIICSILKCIAVLGLEGVLMLKADTQKLVANCIECGLMSNYSEVRIRTLQGFLYILQSLSHEELRNVLPLIQSFLLNELSIRSPGMDPLNMEISFDSRDYEMILWTVAFFLCENLLYSTEDFRSALLDFLHKTFTSPLSALWLMDLLTSGVERLIVSSHTYIAAFNRLAIQVIKNYVVMSNKFPFALRILMACLYHGMYEANVHRIGLELHDSELYLMEQFPTIFKILAEGSEYDASLLLKVLPYLLIDSLNQSEIINNVLKELIHRYPDKPHPRPKAIFTIVHHWFGVLRSRETESVVNEWTLNGLDSFKYITDSSLYRFYVNAFLCSSSSNPYVASLFHIIVNRGSEAAWLDNLWFPFIIRSLLSRLNRDAVAMLRSRMEIYVSNGVEYKDPNRILNFPRL